MKKVCKNCMSRYEGDTCPLCSKTKAEGKQSVRPAMSEKEKKNQRNFLIILCVLGIAFVLFIFYRNGALGSRVYEEPITTYFEAICNRDFDAYTSVMLSEVAAELDDERNELGMEKADYMQTLFADYFEEFGEDMSVTIAFGQSDGVGQEYIDLFAEGYYRDYGVYPDADAFKQLEAGVTFKGSNDTDVIMVRCFLMRDEVKWYMIGCDYLDEIMQYEGE